jgi:putative transposase
MSKKYHSGSHCRYLLKVHLIFVTKYRKKIIANAFEDEIKQIMFDISKESDFAIEIMETDKDHIHFLIDYPPNIAISSIVNRLKSMSTVRVWKKFKTYLKNHYWKEKKLWHDGYFCCSTGDASTDTIKKYIKEQG